MLFGDQVRILRREAKFSQRELAAKAGIDFSYLSKIENCVLGPPSEQVIRRIARELAGRLSGRDEIDLAYELITLAGKFPSDLARSLSGSPSALAFLRKFSQVLPQNSDYPRPREDGAAGNSSQDSRNASIMTGSSIFLDLNRGHIDQLCRMAEIRCLKAGQTVFSEGDPVDFGCIVADGLLKTLKHTASGKDFITGIYGPGEVLGFSRLFDEEPHFSSAYAIRLTEVVILNRCDFVSFFQAHPDLGFKVLIRILNTAGNRRNVTAVRLSELRAEPAERRLARVLLGLCSKLGNVIPLSRSEIAETAGTSTETASRFVSRLSRAGVLQSFRGKIIVAESETLLRLGGTISDFPAT